MRQCVTLGRHVLHPVHPTLDLKGLNNGRLRINWKGLQVLAAELPRSRTDGLADEIAHGLQVGLLMMMCLDLIGDDR